MHQRLTHDGIECVDGVLKCIFSTNTVAQTDSVISINVKHKYFPNRGIANDVEGMVSMSTERKKMSDTIIEMVSVTWSPFVDIVLVVKRSKDESGERERES